MSCMSHSCHWLALILRIPDQNDVSQAWYVVEIYHSGRKPSACSNVVHVTQLPLTGLDSSRVPSQNGVFQAWYIVEIYILVGNPGYVIMSCMSHSCQRLALNSLVALWWGLPLESRRSGIAPRWPQVESHHWLLLLRYQLHLWDSDSPFWVRFLRMWPFFNLTIEVVTVPLHGWCVLGVFLLQAFTRLGHESVLWNACVHRLGLDLTLIWKSFGGMEWEPMLTPREKSVPEARGGLNPQHCIMQVSEPSTLPTELFQPHTSDFKSGLLVANLSSTWCYRVSPRTGWLSVSILWLGEKGSLICSFYL